MRRVKSPARYKPRAGLSIPIVTVLDRAGSVLADEQRAVVRYAIQGGAGADIIFAAGTAGEWDQLDNPRRQLVARIAVEECRKSARKRDARIEAWVGITARTRAQTLDNLKHALEIAADAVVVAPLSIADANDPVEFITGDIGRLFDHSGRTLPVFLHDNADLAAPGQASHLHTRDVKTMSRLEYVRGVNVTAGKAVLGNYTRAAREFGIFSGNPYLIFDLFRGPGGLRGWTRHYWNRYLTQNALPCGVVSAVANLMPCEWQRAWQVCCGGDSALMTRYEGILEQFRTSSDFVRAGKPYRASIACLKAALSDLGVCSSDAVAPGTPALEEAERREFLRNFRDIRRRAAATLEPEWLSEWAVRRPVLLRARRDG
jgi:dihydrodipicolinate synthase/N-acetylneuraminate lyase